MAGDEVAQRAFFIHGKINADVPGKEAQAGFRI